MCMMFGMKPSWNRMYHTKYKTGQYSDPVPLLIGDRRGTGSEY